MSIAPAACTASVCTSVRGLRAFTAAAMAAMGCTVPTSLLAAMMVTSAVSSRTASAAAWGSTKPSPSTGRIVTAQPSRSSASSGSSTAWCSIAEVTMCRPAAAATPRMAALSASVPPDVKTISPAVQPSRPATTSRASSSACRARCASR